MPPIEKRWITAKPIPADIDRALRGYPPILRQILFNRGLLTHQDASNFLQFEPTAGCKPFDLKDMERAVARLLIALKNRQRIAIYGDYDADGVTSTALLVTALKMANADVFPYIPNRFDEGYGLNIQALDLLKQAGADVVITVDCGIRSTAEAKHAKVLEIDLIITDHHHPGPALPDACAIINPKQAGDTYANKSIAGVGLAYKLAAALFGQLPVEQDAAQLLDLVALGTVADLAPLTGENRILVHKGLQLMRTAPRQGVLSLMGVAGIQQKKVNASNIGFSLGPRLNAAGRLDSAMAAFDLLVATKLQSAGELAQKLDNQNRERQDITREIQQRAEELALQTDDKIPLLLFAADADFNAGVVGLAASRLTETYYRPAIVGHSDAEFTRASCRSIPEFHITQALDQCADLLDHHGGHAAAAGFTVSNQNLPELLSRLNRIAEQQLSGLDLRPSISADTEVRLSQLTADLLEHLNWLEPTGNANPQPIFISRNVRVKSARTVGKEKTHLKLTVTDGKITFDAIAFRLGNLKDNLPPSIDILFTFELNEFNGRQTLQLNIKDIKPAGTD